MNDNKYLVCYAMNEFNQQRIKKEDEIQDLDYFLESYQNATGKELQVLQVSERPDFICEDLDGLKYGVELTMITRPPKSRQWDRIVEKKQYMDSEKVIELIQHQSFEKNEKRAENDWTLSENTILVIQLKDISLFELKPFLTNENFPDLSSTSFKEIWLGDYSETEAYDSINTFCLKPKELFGFYQRSNPYQKPYG